MLARRNIYDIAGKNVMIYLFIKLVYSNVTKQLVTTIVIKNKIWLLVRESILLKYISSNCSLKKKFIPDLLIPAKKLTYDFK